MLNSTMMGLSRQFLNVTLGSKRDPAAVNVHVENFFRSPTTSTPQILPGAQAAADLMGNLKDDEATAADILTEESRIQLRPTELTFGVAVGDQPRKIDCFPMAWRVFSANSKAGIVGAPCPVSTSQSVRPFRSSSGNLTSTRISGILVAAAPFSSWRGFPNWRWAAPLIISQFEAFVFGRTKVASLAKSWQCRLLPPPPYVRDPKYCCHNIRPEISSYAVLPDLHIRRGCRLLFPGHNNTHMERGSPRLDSTLPWQGGLRA
jgi:hypothetical protein